MHRSSLRAEGFIELSKVILSRRDDDRHYFYEHPPYAQDHKRVFLAAALMPQSNLEFIHYLKKLVLVVCGFALFGCNHIATQVEGFPELKTTVHQSYLLEINQKCYANLTWLQKLSGSFVFGCTVIDFKNKTCDVYIGHNSPDFIISHELAHCKGGDHADHSISNDFDAWLDFTQTASDHYDKNPPQLIHSSRDGGEIRWDHAYKFGPIPKTNLLEGQLVCDQMAGKKARLKPVGYHAYARNIEGLVIQGGGYMCAQE